MKKDLTLSIYNKDEMRAIIKEVVREALDEFKEVFQENKKHTFERLTRKEAMDFLKVKDSKLNQLRRKGLIKPQRMGGGRVYYDKQQLIDFCRSLEVK